jgi:hypothetical protein
MLKANFILRKFVFLKLTINTANDFRARLRFPRAAGKPPRRFAPVGSYLSRFSRRSLLSCTPINRWNKLETKRTFEQNK